MADRGQIVQRQALPGFDGLCFYSFSEWHFTEFELEYLTPMKSEQTILYSIPRSIATSVQNIYLMGKR